MQAATIAMIIFATIAATRTPRHARWPLWAAILLAVLPFAVTAVMAPGAGHDRAALRGYETADVCWPLGWALLLGWAFRAARKPIGSIRQRKRKP